MGWDGLTTEKAFELFKFWFYFLIPWYVFKEGLKAGGFSHLKANSLFLSAMFSLKNKSRLTYFATNIYNLSIFLPNALFFFVLRLTFNPTETFFKQVTNPSYSVVLHSLSSIITPLADY